MGTDLKPEPRRWKTSALPCPQSCVGIRQLVFAVLACLTLTGPVAAQGGFAATHGLSDVDYQAWVTRTRKEGLRVTHVSGYTVNGTTRFAAIAIDNRRNLAWQARHHLSADEYQQELNNCRGQGYQLVSVTGYPRQSVTNYAAVWVKGADARPWEARHGMTSEQFQAAFTQLGKQGFRPIHVTGYPVGKSHQLAAIWVKDGFRNWAAYHDLTAEQYDQEVKLQAKNGLRPLSVAGYPSGTGTLFAVVFAGDNLSGTWQARHNLTADQYQQKFGKWTAQGYAPAVVSGYPMQGQARYAAVWTMAATGMAKWPLPVSGQAVAGLEAFDRAMQQFMKERHLTGGTLAVMRNGKIVLARGYGYADPFQGKLLGPDTPFRVASVSKPITLALLRKLIREGKLQLNTRIVPLLGLAPPAGQKMDPRWRDITVQHLIAHEGGWDRDKAFDPMFEPLKIARALDKPGPAKAADVIEYMAGQPLQFTPGSKSVYSNFYGYCLLGRVVEKGDRPELHRCAGQHLTLPLGLKSIDLGRTLPQYRNPLEPKYLDSGRTRNVMQPRSKVPVAWPDGGFHLEAMDAHGGLIASAPDLVRFLQAYWMDGQPRKNGSQSNTFFGSLPGTWTMVVRQRPDGVILIWWRCSTKVRIHRG